VSKKSVFVASSNAAGVTQVRKQDGKITSLGAALSFGGADAVVTAVWVGAWDVLLVSTPVALYTLHFASESEQLLSDRTEHEWITGVLDTPVLGAAYSPVEDAVWLVEEHALHRMVPQGLISRFGYHQGLPFANLTSVTVSPGSGMVWASSAFGAVRFEPTLVNPAQDDTMSPGTPDENCAEKQSVASPWQWRVFQGNGWLADNAAGLVLPARDAGPGADTLLVVSASGISTLRSELWLLSEKASVISTFQYPRHDRDKLICSVNLANYGDISSFTETVGDNDGLWTAMAGMGMAYRYAVSGFRDESARKAAWRAFEGLETLNNVTGAFPTFPARSYCQKKNAAEVNGCGTESGEDRWHESNNPLFKGYLWKDDTSSDEIDGHLAYYPLVLDFVAQSKEEKQRVLTVLEGITEGIVRNDLYLVDPTTGKPTTWGFWNPAIVNDNPDSYSERGTNSLEILAFLVSAYSVTGRAIYRDTFDTLVTKHNYIKSCANVKIDNPDDDNHSDNELISLAYHTAFYACERLHRGSSAAGVRLSFREEVCSMSALMLPSAKRSWGLFGGEFSPLWTGVYVGLAKLPAPDTYVSRSVWTLRAWAIDFVNWPVDTSARMDLTQTPFHARDNDGSREHREIRPPSERAASNWNTDPFEINQGTGMQDYSPSTWDLPYYLMRYYRLLA
jgi:hypothetical protein